MNRKISLEKHICKCGNIMEHDGIEVSIMSDIDENSTVLSDLSVYICNACEYKIWVHSTECCEFLKV